MAALLGCIIGLQSGSANEVVTSVFASYYPGMTNETYGYEFTVGSQDISVNALGVWDPSLGVGLIDSHDVGLWDELGNLLTSVTIPSGNLSTLSASGFWYEPISGSLTLSANATYVLGAKYPLWAPSMDTGVIFATTTSDPEITLGDARRTSTMTFAFPDIILGSLNDGYFGPNLDYTVVPEPNTIAILGLGLLAGARLRGSRR